MKRPLLILILLIFAMSGFSQDKNPTAKLMFYNCENLFDTEDDPDKWDEQFLPDTAKYWTEYRYNQKLFHIYQVITAVGKWDSPDFVGLSEIENRKVLEDLISRTPLYNAGYEIVHYESPDGRGIDVGALVKTSSFDVIYDRKVRVTLGDDNRATRDILYVQGVLKSKDTLDVFVNHWPSRWGGQLKSEPKRMRAAEVQRKQVDSLFQISKNRNIIILGDLNDFPHNKSLTDVLNAKRDSYDSPERGQIYNLSHHMEEVGQWSHKYHGETGILDQIIVSGSLLDKNNEIYTTLDDASVFMAEFLLEDDEKNTGKRPNRTYIGFKYHGGYSDHLPVYINLFK